MAGKPGSSAQAVAPVNVIVGKEGLLRDRARLAIVAAVRRRAATPADPHGQNVAMDTLKAGEMTKALEIDLLSPSLFGDERIVILTDCDDCGKEPASIILDAAKDPAPGITLILLHSGEGRQKKMVPDLRKIGARLFEAQAMTKSELPSFVGEEFASHGVKVRRNVIETVIDAVGTDLRELATAISQLSADCGGKVTVDAVRTYYGQSAEVNGFDIAELALRGHGEEALAKVRRAIQLGMPAPLLAAAMTRMVGDVARLHAARGVNPNRDMRKFGMPAWKIRKTLDIAQKWSTPAVAGAVQVAAKLDAASKGAVRNPELILELSVVEIASLAKSSHRRR